MFLYPICNGHSDDATEYAHIAAHNRFPHVKISPPGFHRRMLSQTDARGGHTTYGADINVTRIAESEQCAVAYIGQESDALSCDTLSGSDERACV